MEKQIIELQYDLESGQYYLVRAGLKTAISWRKALAIMQAADAYPQHVEASLHVMAV